MAETLQNDVVLITDDNEAKAYLAFHGRLADLDASDGMPRHFAVWCGEQVLNVAAHFSGFADAEDNGYTVLLIPNDKFTPEQQADLAAAFIENGRDPEGECWAKFELMDRKVN